MNEANDPEVDTGVPPRAVSVLSDGAMDEFPVLKAFQQYVDAEQEKARKRIVMICGVFGALIVILITCFAFVLLGIQNDNQEAANQWQQRNQSLNDKLVEFVMKERDRPSNSPVVVQPTQDNTALLALTAKLEEMRKELDAKNATSVPETKSSAPTANPQLEQMKEQIALEREKIALEKAKMEAEKEKMAVEKAKQKEAELEAYRRRRWPELYAPKAKPNTKTAPGSSKGKKSAQTDEDDVDAEIDAILTRMENDDAAPVSYFDEDETEDEAPSKPTKKTKAPSAARPYKIPVETVKPQPESRWRIPQ